MNNPSAVHSNHVSLQAYVLEMAALRYTPAAVPALDVVLEHVSEQSEAGATGAKPRIVRLQILALAFGVLAERLAVLPLGQMLQLEGYLAPLRASTKPAKSVRLHIQAFAVVEPI